ncbi:MAG: hypothetical protein KA004_05535 [Verrucomicrobiales bacterium]|nr:hypothetical protein [Verrucomicrobiales bacterium]
MKTIQKHLGKLLLLAFAAGLAACQTPTAPGPESCVMCDKCKTVWVKRPSQVGGKFTVMSSKKVHACSDCRSAVETFFKTGVLKHSCAKCGGDMTCCTVQP